MALNPDLVGFVKDSLARGLARDRIERALLESGWPAEQVRRALAGFADIDFPIPVPRPASLLSTREAFLYVLMFAMLFLSSYHLADLLFELINRAYPDPAVAPYPGYSSTLLAIRWSLSALIVSFPVFLYVAWLVGRSIQHDPVKRASRVRRQLTYITLFLASCALIGDVIGVIYSFLGGELTIRFLLKVIVVALIAGTVFGYYLWDLRGDEREPET